jgi:hypothetical protein
MPVSESVMAFAARAIACFSIFPKGVAHSCRHQRSWNEALFESIHVGRDSKRSGTYSVTTSTSPNPDSRHVAKRRRSPRSNGVGNYVEAYPMDQSTTAADLRGSPLALHGEWGSLSEGRRLAVTLESSLRWNSSKNLGHQSLGTQDR